MARRVAGRAACALGATVTAAAVLAGGGPAGAAVRPLGAPARDIQHVRQLSRRPAAARKPPARPRPPAGAEPRAIDIPAIGVDTHLTTLGGATAPAGAGDLMLPVPPLDKAADEAGWYQFTAVPGDPGNAVVVGHVDTFAGPGVFYGLYRLAPGDAVYVTVGGARRRFDVTSVREMSKASFPANQVFGGTARHHLWLITCGGGFDYATGHYLDNIVVSASWVPPPKPGIKKGKRRKG
jgi:LPXTG-site transpeptidase (sortase) family protein